MPHPIVLLVTSISTLLVAQPASACEPIVVWVVLAGPHWLSMSLAGLFAVIAAKCLAFTFLARDIGPIRRPVYMLLGNVVSSVVGIVAALPLLSPVTLFFFLIVFFILGALFASPVGRFQNLTGWSGFSRFTAVGSIVLGLFVTFVFYVLAQEALRAEAYSSYWALKFLYIIPAFGISVFITVLFEEWTIWKLSGDSGAGKNWLAPVLHANLFAFLIAGGIAASIMLPKRMRSPNFLVDLMETLRAAFA